MDTLSIEYPKDWKDYELIDSGDGMKLERFGSVIVARPETQALWKKQKPDLWDTAHAVFAFRDKKGAWDVRRPLPEPWEASWGDARFSAQLTGFKHTGIFPEQAPNWEWTQARMSDITCPTCGLRWFLEMLPVFPILPVASPLPAT